MLDSRNLNKKAALEMSVGTIVTIVLLMSMLVLGLVLIRTIFKGSIENINSIDQSVKGEIQKLFSEDKNKKVVIYPPTRLITIKKGNEDYLGFAFSIRNVEQTSGKFTYNVGAEEVPRECGISERDVDSWIKAGKEGSITIPAGKVMEDPEFVRFIIPDSAPPCLVRYGIDIKKDREVYTPTVKVDLKVESE